MKTKLANQNVRPYTCVGSRGKLIRKGEGLINLFSMMEKEGNVVNLVAQGHRSEEGVSHWALTSPGDLQQLPWLPRHSTE